MSISKACAQGDPLEGWGVRANASIISINRGDGFVQIRTSRPGIRTYSEFLRSYKCGDKSMGMMST